MILEIFVVFCALVVGWLVGRHSGSQCDCPRPKTPVLVECACLECQKHFSLPEPLDSNPRKRVPSHTVWDTVAIFKNGECQEENKCNGPLLTMDELVKKAKKGSKK